MKFLSQYKDIFIDIKTMITNNYNLAAIILLVLPLLYSSWIVSWLVFLLFFMFYGVISHCVGRVAFERHINLPSYTSGWKWLLKEQLKLLFIIGILVGISYWVYVTSDSSSDSSEAFMKYTTVLKFFMDILCMMCISVVVVNICIAVIPNTNVDYIENYVWVRQIPKHYWYLIGFVAVLISFAYIYTGEYYWLHFIGLIIYINMAYVLRYLMGMPPTKKEKIKQRVGEDCYA